MVTLEAHHSRELHQKLAVLGKNSDSSNTCQGGKYHVPTYLKTWA